MLIIGSQALRFLRPDILDREPRDWDLVGTMDEIADFVRERRDVVSAAFPVAQGRKYHVLRRAELPIEIEVAWLGTAAAELLRIVSDEWVTCAPPTRRVCGGLEVVLPSVDVLLELKLSHRYLKNSPHFLKTMQDVRTLRAAGAKVSHPEWLRAREKETYAYKHPRLDVRKDEFFAGDGVRYVYDHDAVHEAVQHLGRPAYTFYKDPESEVKCSRALFEAHDEQVRLFGVLEEAYVLAIERSLVPHPGVLSPRKAFDMALMKVCTSITSGWFREYAWEHYDEVVSLYRADYFARFQDAVAAGKVPPASAPRDAG